MNPLQFFKELSSQLFEKVPIINEENRIIGKTSRISSFLLRKPYRAVNIFIFKDKTKKELLLQKRQWWLRFPLKWGDCTGAVPSNRSYEEAAYKELQEEIFHNQPLPKIKLKKIAEFKDSSTKPYTWNQLFLAQYRGLFFPSPFEVKELLWMPVEKIQADLQNPKRTKKYTPAFKDAWKVFIKVVTKE